MTDITPILRQWRRTIPMLLGVAAAIIILTTLIMLPWMRVDNPMEFTASIAGCLIVISLLIIHDGRRNAGGRLLRAIMVRAYGVTPVAGTLDRIRDAQGRREVEWFDGDGNRNHGVLVVDGAHASLYDGDGNPLPARDEYRGA